MGKKYFSSCTHLNSRFLAEQEEEGEVVAPLFSTPVSIPSIGERTSSSPASDQISWKWQRSFLRPPPRQRPPLPVQMRSSLKLTTLIFLAPFPTRKFTARHSVSASYHFSISLFEIWWTGFCKMAASCVWMLIPLSLFIGIDSVASCKLRLTCISVKDWFILLFWGCAKTLAY